MSTGGGEGHLKQKRLKVEKEMKMMIIKSKDYSEDWKKDRERIVKMKNQFPNPLKKKLGKFISEKKERKKMMIWYDNKIS